MAASGDFGNSVERRLSVLCLLGDARHLGGDDGPDRLAATAADGIPVGSGAGRPVPAAAMGRIPAWHGGCRHRRRDQCRRSRQHARRPVGRTVLDKLCRRYAVLRPILQDFEPLEDQLRTAVRGGNLLLAPRARVRGDFRVDHRDRRLELSLPHLRRLSRRDGPVSLHAENRYGGKGDGELLRYPRPHRRPRLVDPR